VPDAVTGGQLPLMAAGTLLVVLAASGMNRYTVMPDASTRICWPIFALLLTLREAALVEVAADVDVEVVVTGALVLAAGAVVVLDDLLDELLHAAAARAVTRSSAAGAALQIFTGSPPVPPSRSPVRQKVRGAGAGVSNCCHRP
jgi:hypothetical protein